MCNVIKTVLLYNPIDEYFQCYAQFDRLAVMRIPPLSEMESFAARDRIFLDQLLFWACLRVSEEEEAKEEARDPSKDATSENGESGEIFYGRCSSRLQVFSTFQRCAVCSYSLDGVAVFHDTKLKRGKSELCKRYR